MTGMKGWAVTQNEQEERPIRGSLQSVAERKSEFEAHLGKVVGRTERGSGVC